MTAAGRVGDVESVVGRHRANSVACCFDEVTENVGVDTPREAVLKLGKGALAGALARDRYEELALLGRDFADVDVTKADSLVPRGLLRHVALDLVQPADALGPGATKR